MKFESNIDYFDDDVKKPLKEDGKDNSEKSRNGAITGELSKKEIDDLEKKLKNESKLKEDFNDFIDGFMLGSDIENRQEAEDQWAGYSRAMSDSQIKKIEDGGYDSGLEMGEAFLKDYPIEESKLSEIRSLVQINIYWNGKTSFTLNYPGGQKVFNGSPEAFAKFLKQLGAKEASTKPRSLRTFTYKEIVDAVMTNKDPNIYVWSNRLADIPEMIINESESKVRIQVERAPAVIAKTEEILKELGINFTKVIPESNIFYVDAAAPLSLIEDELIFADINYRLDESKLKESYGDEYILADMKRGVTDEGIVNNIISRYPSMTKEQARKIVSNIHEFGFGKWNEFKNPTPYKGSQIKEVYKKEIKQAWEYYDEVLHNKIIPDAEDIWNDVISIIENRGETVTPEMEKEIAKEVGLKNKDFEESKLKEGKYSKEIIAAWDYYYDKVSPNVDLSAEDIWNAEEVWKIVVSNLENRGKIVTSEMENEIAKEVGFIIEDNFKESYKVKTFNDRPKKMFTRGD